MHHVFASYSRADGDWVGMLVKRLKQLGYVVWIDQADIPVSVPWLAEVQDAIEEAALFLCCNSPAFQHSASCAAEVALAEQAAKPRLVVTVGDDLDLCVSRIVESLQGIDPARAKRTELRVLARDWDRAGRPRNQLSGRAQRRRLAAGLAVSPDATDVEVNFLDASKSRSRRRAFIASVVVLLITASSLTIAVLRTAQNTINTTNSQIAASEQQEQSSLEAISQDPYHGLQMAAADGTDESGMHAEIVTAALAQPTPDDAFAVPRARHFAVRPIGAEVIVTTATGQDWQHPAAIAAAGAAATRLSTAVPAGQAAPASGGLTAEGGQDSGRVTVFRNGKLFRTIYFDGVTSALAFSPDGRFLAATVGEQVEVADVATAEVRVHLRGAIGDLLDVAWGADGTHVWALDGARVFGWQTGDATTLLDVPGGDFNSVLPAATPGRVWVVSPHALTEVSAQDGQVYARKTIDDTLYSAGGAPDGSFALASGTHRLWVIPLSGDSPLRSVAMPATCELGRPTVSDDTSAYLPCIGGALLRLSLPSATIAAIIPVSANAGVYGATAVPGQDVAYAGDEAGYLYMVHGTQATPLYASECDVDISRVAVAPGQQAVLPVGSGSGQGTCTTIGLLNRDADPAQPMSWTWNHVIEPQELSVYASAVSFSPRGSDFAIGYSDGTITMHPTVNVTPAIVVDTADGMIRDMLTLPNGDLIVATDTGMVQRLTLCDSCISNAVLSKVAAARLRLAVGLGLARKVQVSNT